MLSLTFDFQHMYVPSHFPLIHPTTIKCHLEKHFWVSICRNMSQGRDALVHYDYNFHKSQPNSSSSSFKFPWVQSSHRMRPPVLLLIHLSLCGAAKIFRKWLSVIIRATYTNSRVCFIFIEDMPQFPIFRCHTAPLALSPGTISCYFTFHILSHP